MRRSTTSNKRTYQLLGTMLILMLWQGLSFLYGAFVVPGPVSTAIRLLHLLSQGETYVHIGATGIRVLSGFCAALVIALPWGMLAGRSRRVEAFSVPGISLLRSVPVVSIIIIVLFFFGSKLMPSVISLLVVIPIIYTNVRTGVEGIDPLLLDMAKVYRVGTFIRWRDLFFRGMLPYLFAGVEISLGIAFKAVVAGEVISPPSRGIGASILNAKLYLDLEGALAWTAIALLFSYALERLIKRIREGALAWKKI